jgi:hypothetical protein
MTSATDVPTTVPPVPRIPAPAPWTLRINPLERHRISDGALRARLADLAAADRALRARADRLGDALFESIGTAEGAERGRLVALRRDIHNGRVPKADPGLPGYPEWVAERGLVAELRARIAQEHDAVVRRERLTLAGLLGQDDFQRSLAMVSPEVSAAAVRYRAAAGDHGTVSARARKSERGLLQYATRAMIRTSPISRFTAVGLMVPDDRARPVEEHQHAVSGAVAFHSLDRIMLDYVLGGLTHGPGVTPDSYVQIPPTAQSEEGGRIYFLRPTPDGVQRRAVPMAGVVLFLHEATSMGPRLVSEVAEYLMFRAGITHAQALQAVRGAVDVGLLCTRSLVEDGVADVAALLHAGLGAGRELGAAVAGALGDVARVPTPDLPGHLASLRGSLDELSRVAVRPAKLLVEEDYLLPPRSVRTSDLDDQLDDLSSAVEVLSVFDHMHEVRSLLLAAFVRRFGAGADVLLAQHAGELTADVYASGGDYGKVADVGAGPGDGSLGRLRQVRDDITRFVRTSMAQAHADGGEVVWDRADAISLTAGLPDCYRGGHLSYHVLTQLAGDRLVFNDAYAGHGILYGRFLAADRAMGGTTAERVRERLEDQYGGPGIRVAEDTGFHRLNVNARLPVLDSQVTPSEWFELRLCHDPVQDRLLIRDAAGAETRVLTLGAGHPEFYPAPLKIAVWLLSAGRLFEDLPRWWKDSTGWTGRDTLSCPSIRLGRAVISRRRWYAGKDFEDSLTGPADGPDRLLALHAWRHANGVPAEVVLKTPLDDEYRDEVDRSGDSQDEHRRRQKPQYVDLDSSLLVHALPRFLERRSEGYVEEALPAVETGPHAAEWLVEIGRRERSHFTHRSVSR